MVFDKIKGLSPSMQSKYWGEICRKEDREHRFHPLNTQSEHRRDPSLPIGNPNDFHAQAWNMLRTQHHQAAGSASPLVEMARRYTAAGPGPATSLSRPATGASVAPSNSSSRRSGRPPSMSVPPPQPFRAG
mmetsp:Transcript_24184/g.56194  ORF Transcript_24184/g.56194 Transcript_24184/m.56194 type:complete len:131 (+) Transcript_24184:82-474(+)